MDRDRIRWLRWIGLALAALVAVYLAIPAYIWLASEAVIDRRYTLPRSLVRADSTPDALARGARLAVIDGCADCHGAKLTGKLLQSDSAFPVFASNLRALTATYADEDFDRAIRRGLRPDASSLWAMPSPAFVYVHDDDIAAILGYLRSRPPAGAETPPPTFGSAARREIVQDTLQPVAPLVLVQMPAIDLGPHYDGGRYIAMMACGSCHATELIGSTDGRVPDLNVTTHYSREQFFDLMRRGVNARGHWLPTMGPLARKRFHILKDWEIDPLYAYLVARAKAPTIDQISNSIR
jgi:cytochrome c553